MFWIILIWSSVAVGFVALLYTLKPQKPPRWRDYLAKMSPGLREQCRHTYLIEVGVGYAGICGNCGYPANVTDAAHTEVASLFFGDSYPGVEPCGTTFQFVASDPADRDTAESLRPDLLWVPYPPQLVARG